MRGMSGIGGTCKVLEGHVKHRRDIHYWMSMSGIGGVCQVYEGHVRHMWDISGI